MPSLTIKGIPAALLDQLRTEAKRDYRSLNGQVLKLLDEATRQRILREASAEASAQQTADWLADLDAVKARLPPLGANETWQDIEAAIGGGRE